MCKMNNVIDAAKSFLGVHEGTAEHAEIIALYNKARYHDAYKMTLTDPWCAAFVVACFEKAQCADLIPCVASCDSMITYFKQWGRWHSVREGTVTKGDILFYDWNSDGGSDHVGIVCSNNMGLLQVIEGNKSDNVGYRNIRLSDPTIVGVGRPNYGGSDSQSTNTGSIITPITQYSYPYSSLSSADKRAIKSFPIIYLGSIGVYVGVLQTFLNYHIDAELDIDMDFGELTKNALRSWQKKRNLEVDGVAGRETWASFFV